MRQTHTQTTHRQNKSKRSHSQTATIILARLLYKTEILESVRDVKFWLHPYNSVKGISKNRMKGN